MKKDKESNLTKINCHGNLWNFMKTLIKIRVMMGRTILIPIKN